MEVGCRKVRSPASDSGHPRRSKRWSRKEKTSVQTAPVQGDLGRIGCTRERGEGYRETSGEERRAADRFLDHPSADDRFGSTMARPERKRDVDPGGSVTESAVGSLVRESVPSLSYQGWRFVKYVKMPGTERIYSPVWLWWTEV